MTEKEVGELRRRLRADRTNITAICGCYVSDRKEIMATFRESFGLLNEEDKENYLSLLKRVLSGMPDKNRLDLSFRTEQVADSDEHRLLMTLRKSELKDEEARMRLYQTIIDAYPSETHYLILLAHESYDVPFRAKDGSEDGESEETFSYILCAVCPVKQGKSALSYCAEEKTFHYRSTGYAASAPELGFLFPAFDGRKTNIYNTLYYAKSGKDNHPEVAEALFHLTPPDPAETQKNTFGSIISSTLQDECSLEVMQTVNNELRQKIEIHRETKCEDPLEITKEEVRSVLRDCGVSEEHLAAFSVSYDRQFGEDAHLSPRNLVSSRRFELKTPDVAITVNPERSDLIETRIFGGVPYLVIRADEGVEVNGVNIQIPTE